MGKLQIVKLERVEKKRGPGRPPKIPIEPVDEEVAQLMRNKRKHLRDNPLITRLEEAPHSMDILDLAMLELAKEAGSLDFERSEAERKGKDTTSISSKKISATKAVIDTFLKKRETMLDETFDFRSQNFKLLFEFWGNKIEEACMESQMPDEMIQRFFSAMQTVFEDWEKEALKYIKAGGRPSA